MEFSFEIPYRKSRNSIIISNNRKTIKLNTYKKDRKFQNVNQNSYF